MTSSRSAAPPPPSGPRTAFLLHEAAALHDTGWGHPEHQGRLRAVVSALEKELPSLHGAVAQVTPDPATEADLRRVHTPRLIESVRQAVAAAAVKGRVASLEADTKVSGASWDAALGTVGAGLHAVRLVSSGAFRNAFVAARPPGHHATPDRAMGFCLFNNVAVAAADLRASGAAERALIVDWDVHHGNGTQDVFYADPAVFFLSLHQHPHYPGTGAVGETGAGAGRGFTLNVPLAAATPRAEYLAAFSRALDVAAARSKPDFVLVSAGFDVLAGDPLGGQLLEPPDLHRMTREVLEVADQCCEGRVVVFLEGGYDPARTGLGCAEVVRALAGLEMPRSAKDQSRIGN